VFSAAEVSEYAVEFDAMFAIVPHGPPEDGPRSIRKPDSLKELSFQARSMRLGPTAFAASAVGAMGIVCGVDALATFEYVEKLLPLNVRTR
jgi:hypothetical protein